MVQKVPWESRVSTPVVQANGNVLISFYLFHCCGYFLLKCSLSGRTGGEELTYHAHHRIYGISLLNKVRNRKQRRQVRKLPHKHSNKHRARQNGPRVCAQPELQVQTLCPHGRPVGQNYFPQPGKSTKEDHLTGPAPAPQTEQRNSGNKPKTAPQEAQMLVSLNQKL